MQYLYRVINYKKNFKNEHYNMQLNIDIKNKQMLVKVGMKID